MTRATNEKVARLLRQCRVTPAGAASVYRVKGDHDEYVVVIGDGFAACTCPTPVGGECSHLASALLLNAAIENADDLDAKTTAAA